MIVYVLTYWFKIQTRHISKSVLSSTFTEYQIKQLLDEYWKEYKTHYKKRIPKLPTLGGTLMVNLAAMSAAFYEQLKKSGLSETKSTQLFYEIAWQVYKKMGKLTWFISGLSNNNSSDKLKRATQIFRYFPFNSPSYHWQDVSSDDHTIAFNCTKCPVAEYFKELGLAEFCENTWCALDFPLANLWEGELERTGSIAGGAELCDFRWKTN